MATTLNAEYIHHGVGCGSNHRIWRRFFDYAQKGLLNETTLVTIQWTEVIRSELFWAHPLDNSSIQDQDSFTKEFGFHDSVSHLDGTLFKFKTDAWKWHGEYPDVANHMRDFTNNCLSDKWSSELLNCYDFNIREYCKSNNVPLVLIDLKAYQIEEIKDNYLNVVSVDEIAKQNPRIMEDGREDYAHMSTKGHKLFSEKILKQINKIEL